MNLITKHMDRWCFVSESRYFAFSISKAALGFCLHLQPFIMQCFPPLIGSINPPNAPTTIYEIELCSTLIATNQVGHKGVLVSWWPEVLKFVSIVWNLIGVQPLLWFSRMLALSHHTQIFSLPFPNFEFFSNSQNGFLVCTFEAFALLICILSNLSFTLYIYIFLKKPPLSFSNAICILVWSLIFRIALEILLLDSLFIQPIFFPSLIMIVSK